jgi:glycosyltransferase involved in cell wall biosynthesis
VFSGRGFALADEALMLAHALRIPTVAWLHGGNLPGFAQAHERWTQRVLRSADAVVSPTSYLGRWAAGIVPNTIIVPNVLDLERYPFRARHGAEARLLWMRTFQELYDPATAVRTLAELRSSGVPATMTMAGQDKGSMAWTKSLARSLGVDEWIQFPGFVSGAEKAMIFDTHDVFLNSNIIDNAPVTVLEAAASGLAIVSTNVGGVPDLIEDGTSGLLVPPRAPHRMADAVRRVLTEPGLAQRLGRSARLTAESSAWPAVLDQWTEVFRRLGVNPGRPEGRGSPPP